MTGRTRVFGLVGHPVDRSRSPELHNAWFAAHGIDAVYAAFDVSPGLAGGVVAAIRTLGLAGVNVTVPLKEAVVPGLDACSAEVDRAQAANVVVRDADRLVGHNTDGDGWVRAFEDDFGPVAGRAIAVLGAGGSGRAIASAALRQGASRVWLLNRDVARARSAAARLGPGCVPGALDSFAALRPDVVVCAVAGGGAAAVEALPVAQLGDDAVWCDLNYWDPSPPRVAACRARGLRVQGGLPMLVHQAALSFGLFTGVTVDLDDVRARLR